MHSARQLPVLAARKRGKCKVPIRQWHLTDFLQSEKVEINSTRRQLLKPLVRRQVIVAHAKLTPRQERVLTRAGKLQIYFFFPPFFKICGKIS